MPSVHIPRPWELPERLVTPEAVYIDRRRFLSGLGLAGGGLLLAGWAGSGAGAPAPQGASEPVTAPGSRAAPPGAKLPPALAEYAGAPGLDLYPAGRNGRFAVERPPTDEAQAARYCNFYEFTTGKNVYRHVRDYEPYPWTVEVAGLCDNPRTWDLDTLVRKFPLEERVYRHRCVEAWSTVMPWTGFPFAALVKASQPRSAARYLRCTSFLRPDEAPGQKQGTYKWPYYEAIRIDEALNELTLFTVGAYGHPLPKQHGAPWRLVLPWKYGYKGAKAIVKIEFMGERPRTFWNDLQPREYGFYSNVNPDRHHPRWSQATERVLDTGERIPTLPYNGYAAQVGSLYPDEDPE